MAGSSFFALFDDIAVLLDDIAAMSKVAAKKTAGVLGDDLALNAQQVTGVHADRELPVVWAVAKSSLINKAILVPAALGISAWASWLITPLLMLGGLYLCYEGSEKILHVLFHKKQQQAQAERVREALKKPNIDMVSFEKDKIKGAIRTDFILSAEIIVIALGTAANATLAMQAMVLTVIALGITVGVYGAVAGIVRMDDVGLTLIQKSQKLANVTGRFLLWLAPKLMKFLSIFGTAAMFLVGGGILVHGLTFASELMHNFEHALQALPFSSLLTILLPALATAIAGFIVGLMAVFIVYLGAKILPGKTDKNLDIN